MKPVMLLLGACIIILLLPSIIPAIQDFRSESYTEAHGAVTTAVGVTTANLTLTQDLFLDETSQVDSASSSLGTDVPLTQTYTAASDRLLISGLTANATRTLTVIYKIGILDNYYGADLGARVWPLFLGLGIIGIAAAAVYTSTRKD